MKTFLVLALAGACGSAAAQTPATNPMPDGSRDMYAGLGVSVQPRYDGADAQRTRALPLLQFEFSNGVFVSGLSAGWHLARSEALEAGPLLAVQPRRSEAGMGRGAGGVSPDKGFGFGMGLAPTSSDTAGDGRNRLTGMGTIKSHLMGGGFLNYYLTPQLRLTNTVLYGAGGDGLLWEVGMQRVAAEFSAHHKLSASVGATLVNRAYNQRFFGVGVSDSLSSGHPLYSPGGGLKDVYLGARWNWALSPSLMLTTSGRVSRLTGDARRSPLVERPTQYSISTGLVVRF